MNPYQQPRALLLDHLDSFSRNVADALFQSGFEPLLWTVEPGRSALGGDPELRRALDTCDALVLSPGPGHPRDYDTADLRTYLVRVRPELPVFGICLGLQILLDWDHLVVEPLGAPDEPAVHGRVRPMGPNGFKLPQPFANLNAAAGMVFYNSLGVRWPGASAEASRNWSLVPSADKEAFVTMAVHRRFPWLGVQFHPESFASPEGTEVFTAFAGFCAALSTRFRQGETACSAASMPQPL